jgi:lipopolysaccharide transport system permease protein
MPWKTVITSRKGWWNVPWRELIHYRDLLALLVRRDFVTQYKQSLLGPLWFVIQPLLNTLVFTIIFGHIAKIPTDGVPPMLFYMAGNVLWALFAATFNDVCNVFSQNMGMFSKIYFPRLISPTAVAINKVFTFGLQLAVFLAFLVYFQLVGASSRPSWLIAFLPLLVLHVSLLATGTGFIIASLTTKYRDLKFLITFGLQLWMYASPVVYPSSLIPADFAWVSWLNPMAPVIELFRKMFLGEGQFSWAGYGLSAAETVVLIIVGLSAFSRTEKDFIDRI